MGTDDVVRRSDELDEKIAGSADIKALVLASRRNQRMIRLLAISLAFDVLLTLALAVVTVQTEMVVRQANSLQAQAHATCLASNEARAGQVTLWHHLLDLPPAAPRTPEQQEQADAFGRYVDHLFAPRQC